MAMFTRRHESGAVSLFIVIFAMLLITVVTLGFLRIMINDQQQASDADLSKSAYDSSLAGVEDAKRALIYYRTVCATSDTATCTAVRNAMNTDVCNAGIASVDTTIKAGDVVPVQQSQSANDSQLNQAYTCVKIALNTPDYVKPLKANTSELIPLRATKDFSSVTIQWYSKEDLPTNTTSVDLLSEVKAAAARPLLSQSNWVASRPSLLRAQLIQFGSNFTLDSFDAASSSAVNSNANTLFLYPTGNTNVASTDTDTWSFSARNTRQVPTGSPQPTKCSGLVTGAGYACSVTLTLPAAVGQAADDTTRTAYLRLTPLYNATHVRVTLSGGAQFDGVQPTIDSTGRANDLYRRVESRVNLVDTTFPYPEAAVDLTGNLCKDFVVTDTADSTGAQNKCTP